MRIVLMPAHPSQVYLLRALEAATAGQWDCVWLIRDKDVSLAVATALGIRFETLTAAGTGRWRNAVEFGFAYLSARRALRTIDPDCVVTKYGPGNIAARVLGVPSVAFNDDDADVVPLIAWTSYPFAKALVSPEVTRLGRWSSKALRYAGYHELAYLHPDVFIPEPSVRDALGLAREEEFAIVRLSALRAHHDHGERGISDGMLEWLVDRLGSEMRVFLSSEAQLRSELEHLRLPVDVASVHSALAAATVFVGDSQTMTAEAAVLGTPAVRLSSLRQRLSYLQDIEGFGLAASADPGDERGCREAIESGLALSRDGARIEAMRGALLANRVGPVPALRKAVEQVVADELR